MGDPMRPLRWVSKSREKLATALHEMGHKVSASSIPKLLGQLGYRRHVNRKTKDGSNHPDRDAQFEYINAKAREFQAADQPVISVDTKKKELIGEFKNPGNRLDRFGSSLDHMVSILSLHVASAHALWSAEMPHSPLPGDSRRE